MKNSVTCPVCGEQNPADRELCQNCKNPLRRTNQPRDMLDKFKQSGGSPNPKAASDSEGSIPEWLRQARQQALKSAADIASKGGPEKSASVRAEDLLAGLASQGGGSEDETPAWVARITGKGAGKNAASEEHPFGQLDANTDDEPDAGAPGGSAEDEHDELSAWFEQASTPDRRVLQSADGESSSDDGEIDKEGLPDKGDDIDDWLRRLDASAAQPPAKAGLGTSAQGSIPEWVRELGAASAETVEPEIHTAPEAIPEWLRGPQETGLELPPPSIPAAGPTAGTDEPEVSATPVAAFIEGPESAATASSMAVRETPPQAAPGTSAFTPEALAGIDVDAIFASMEMPDWLSDLKGGERAGVEQHPSALQESEGIAPAELPSWVQAMRPVESAMPRPEPQPVDQRLEEHGPLLGLHGVLPAIAGATMPSSKPRSHSIRLEASPQQQAHAALLEQIVEAETTPIPVQGALLPGSQRMLRWGISAALLLLLSATVFSHSEYIPLPVAVPNETAQAIQVVENVPPDAPVLLVFDYEPATMGEMEATAASLVDHMLLLKHPRLAILSTSPTGSALAERFMSTTVAPRAYQRGVQYVDLGYLPGGLAGVNFFAQDPVAAMPLGADSSRAWESDVLHQVSHLSDFAAIIVLTDGLEAGRVWIEQTTAARGTSPLIIVSSAQTGPMLLPYVDSGQIGGLVAGLNGAAGSELANGGLPGLVRRYWDAYSFGLYAAVLLIVLGGSWYFWLGLQERRAEVA